MVTTNPLGSPVGADAEQAMDSADAAKAIATRPYSLGQLVAYAFKLGSHGFGGPVALVGYLHRDLVEQRKWISDADYKEGLALAQLMPGPLAAQLAIYLGYVHYRIVARRWSALPLSFPRSSWSSLWDGRMFAAAG